MAILSEESKLESVVGRSFEMYKVFSATAAAASSDEIDARNAEQIALQVVAGSGVSSGVVKLEGSPTSAYAGTWLDLGSLTINGASKIFGVSLGIGATTGLPIKYVRARISTLIGGGTITAYVIIQK